MRRPLTLVLIAVADLALIAGGSVAAATHTDGHHPTKATKAVALKATTSPSPVPSPSPSPTLPTIKVTPSAKVVVPSHGAVTSMALDDSHVAWLETTSGTADDGVWTGPAGGGTGHRLVGFGDDVYGPSIFLTANTVVWEEIVNKGELVDWKIRSVPAGGGTATTLDSAKGAKFYPTLTANNGEIAWVSGASFQLHLRDLNDTSRDLDGQCGCYIATLGPQGELVTYDGTTFDIVTRQTSPHELTPGSKVPDVTVTGSNLVWAEGGGSAPDGISVHPLPAVGTTTSIWHETFAGGSLVSGDGFIGLFTNYPVVLNLEGTRETILTDGLPGESSIAAHGSHLAYLSTTDDTSKSLITIVTVG